MQGAVNCTLAGVAILFAKVEKRTLMSHTEWIIMTPIHLKSNGREHFGADTIDGKIMVIGEVFRCDLKFNCLTFKLACLK